MHCLTTPTLPAEARLGRPSQRLALLFIFSFFLSWTGLAQETDFSPFARFGLGTAQGALTPTLASMGGITSVSASQWVVNADQPAAAAGLTHPTFQGSVHVQGMRLTEGDRVSHALTGGPGNFGLVVKQPRSRSALQLGLTPLSSKAFSITRAVEDTLLGNILESYDGSGGLARAYLGLAHGWRGRTWVTAGSTDSVLVSARGLDVGAQVDHWFGDALQTSRLDIEDLSYRDVRTVVSSRHRATGAVFGAEAFQVLRAKYDEYKQFKGSWVLRAGATWSPQRTLNTDYFRLVESTLIVNNVVAGIDTSAFDEAVLSGAVPQKWTAGVGLQWDGPQGNRVGIFVDHRRQAWSEAAESLPYLMDGAGTWGDASTSALGLTWTPGRKPGKIVRPTYRAGFSQSTLPLALVSEDGEDAFPLEEWRVSLGMNTPLKGSRSASQLHLGMDVGQRHTELASVHRETNVRLHVGVTLTPFVKNLWLTPRLYD
ncbi:MAG: hypothetical protein ACPG66_00375 [Flavobacteriales bacterium]